jgi:hypothetical protein
MKENTMHLDEHCKDCLVLLGKGYLDVHLFLDKMNKEFPYQIFGDYHRTFLHNTYGLAIIRDKMGEGAHQAGLIHLHADYLCTAVRKHLGKETVLERAKKNMPFWDNCVYIDMAMLEPWKGGRLCRN